MQEWLASAPHRVAARLARCRRRGPAGPFRSRLVAANASLTLEAEAYSQDPSNYSDWGSSRTYALWAVHRADLLCPVAGATGVFWL